MKKNDKFAVVALSFLPFVMVIGNSMFIPILPSIEADLQISSNEAGLILTSFSVPAALIIPFTGYLADRFGRKQVIITALAIVCLGSLISLLSPVLADKRFSYYLLLFGRLLQGAGAGATSPLAMAVIGDLFTGKTRSTALGTVEVFNGLGKMLSPFFGIAAMMLIWYGTFLFYFFVSLAALTAIYLVINIDRQPEAEKFSLYISSIRSIVKRESRWLLPVVFTGGAMMFILFGLLIYLAYEAERQYHITGLMKGMIFVLPLGLLTLSSFVSGRIIGRGTTGIKMMLSLGFSIILLVLIGGMVYHSFIMTISVLSFFSMGTGFLLPCCNFFVTGNVSKKERGIAVSLYAMIRFLGVAFGPYIYSIWMYDEWWMFMYSFLIVSATGLWLCAGWLSLRKQQSLFPSTA
ncbi:MFS transporter, ACDE family, multidrug resistance protein [Evansella caseinilytica]|uniref:MFS transporter, ACDE family, multidrug resistance protein n=1 Tax=Evansella caseinilytica TaxID=1503961 RepID=A0A1H3KMA0_9BACI|nr:MFS transporter [Evansella caseinilytica]SDY53303.1 MFS transporter, ACDE family, multidrug resistance protein [Evansella caseinilytica]